MADFSFDVVSKVDMTIVDECVNVAMKEITNRYDFKDSNSSVDIDRKTNELKLSSSDEFKVQALFDVLQTRFAKRGLPLKNFDPQKIESALGGTAKQVVKIQQGIPSEKAKEISKFIKDSKLKVNASIQGEQLRVASRSKDDLQNAIALLRGKDFGIQLQFENYR